MMKYIPICEGKSLGVRCSRLANMPVRINGRKFQLCSAHAREVKTIRERQEQKSRIILTDIN